jgi:cell division transport system ATP-binding protein
VGLIFQDHRLLTDRTVFENVALPLIIAGRPAGDEMTRRVRAALDQVSLLHRENACPPTLSGGEQQRVGIARAIVGKPELLLADEPTGNLDPALSRDIMDLFLRLNATGTSVLVASHDLILIRSLGKPMLVLEDGELSHVDEALKPAG